MVTDPQSTTTTKKELVARIAGLTGNKQVMVKKIIQAFLDQIIDELAKGNRLPRECGMHPHVKPTMPSVHALQRNGRNFPPNFLHESWRDFLYWDTELDPW